ncbi:hypothetical protein A2276_08215 [candidate division WOR-1 bacterium RIFOXYA12_FULL_43_27]|uniref:Uncharacterized protein n=1 Tax=candidate division WOR-1 bacterium RIFOXYC2_FULL_46_14 TaxID=1802587 RepID=A0A1F4U6G9_UNCSA|nr:MAG: hypothetical protein A2276_08215 [candidate division WOR-1 bacterium RIFOXYA12_FULL_43_27]OGC20579.1 MAG: hypothetical protein A2292_06040 [candidate division WOR-1 bacterium RIFOXYB2_FULL_46_45]OGC31684.1 MAG: hypothetical protein A2232_05410 [candidate division WOR-1 bacterium RIFOXYA2_FULL_46_56]OGC40420.1 MAG: hypothetical protein A2438_04070 [candidate division WOR-1 bacterium RIFOXYC2_FULL_46_14]
MEVKRPEEKKMNFSKQPKVEKRNIRAGRCIYSADALCFAPKKRYRLCEECPRIKDRDKDKNEKKLYKKIIGSAIYLLGQNQKSPPPHTDLKI